MQPSEEWRAVVGYEGIYEVSADGALKRVGRAKGTRPGRILRPQRARTGHLYYSLSSDNRVRHVFAHRMVARAFLGEPGPNEEVCHYDGDPTNNRVSNLRWGTRAENKADDVRNGVHSFASKERCPRGHLYDERNTYIQPSNGARICRACRAVHKAKYKSRLMQS